MSDYTPTSKPVTGSWNTSKVVRDEFALVATIECNEIGVFVARAFGGADFWTALAVEDALMEVLS